MEVNKAKMMEDTGRTCIKCYYEDLGSYEFPCEVCACGYGEDDMWKSKDDPADEPEEPVIKDSGKRRGFESGAVRDICEGKGRCDLMPLDVLGAVMQDPVFSNLADFMCTRQIFYLYNVLDSVSGKFWSGKADMFLELARHFEDGAKKYGERNWEKGLPIHCYIDSAARHYLKWLRGDKDEPHDRAFVWNIVCCIWTMMHKPEMDDLPKWEEKEND